MTTHDSQSIKISLSDAKQAWQQGNRLVLSEHGRWHYITLDYDMKQIVAVSFVSEEQAENLLSTMMNDGALTPFADISPNFSAELAEKVLPDAEAYRPLLENGRCRLIIGHTTDTLRELEADIDTLVKTIQQRMDGKRGAYLSFR
jgi:ABC-type Zn uptake system ZnuABC Zn-binding protein ZnuA